MNGEEAAASLFGSEDSGSDLFATLGAETTSTQPATKDLFSSQASSHAQQNDTYDFLSDTQSYSAHQSEFLEYPSHPTETHIQTGSANITQNGSAEQKHWIESESNGAGSAYPSLPNAQPIEHVPQTTAAYNNYTPSAYSVGFTSHSSYDAYDPPMPIRPPSTTRSPYTAYNSTVPITPYTTHSAYDHAAPVPATTQAIHGAYVPTPSPINEPAYGTHDSHVATSTRPSYGTYDPPEPATRADYRSYEPLVPNTSTTQSSYHPSEPYSHPITHSNYGTYNPPAPTPTTRPYDPPVNPYHKAEHIPTPVSVNSAPPVQTVIKSTIARPKVSNAYDPPFLTTLPTRRGSRPGTVTAQQAFAQYQKPSAPYYAQTVETSAGSDVHHNQSAISHNESRRSSTPNGYVSETIARQPNDDEPHHSPELTNYNDLSDYNSSNFAHDDIISTNDTHKEAYHVDESLAYNTHEAITQHIAEEHTDITKTVEETLPPPIPVGSSNEPNQPSIASPASIPLPYSPPIEDVHEHDRIPLSSSESVDKMQSYQSLYIPQVAPKKDVAPNKDVIDPYTPRNAHNPNNYIPRTSSPLSTHNGRPSDAKRALNVSAKPTLINSPPYGAIPKPMSGIMVPVNPYNLPTNSSLDNPTRQASQWSDARPAPQELLMKPAITQYAPSPSLIGANDPLSRTSARAPLVNFGFGGKMITCFHGMPGLNAGFDVAFSSRTTSELKIRTLHKILPESTLTAAESSYPGPLLADPGTASISLVRSNLATQTKSKKASVLSYLAGRVSEIQQGLGYLSGSDGRTAENKLILVKLLSVMVENDGRLLGTPQAEAAVRSTLVPRLEGAPMIQDAVSLQASYKLPASDEAPISVTTLRPSALDKIEELLLQGDRRQAYQFAMDEKLWAHAMVIASSIDKESWKDVVHDFLRTELAVKSDTDNSTSGPNGKVSNSQFHKSNRESLRVAYSLFSGQGTAAIQELAPASLLQRGLGGHFQPAPMPAITPRTPNFASIPPTNLPSIPAESLTKWAETVAMMISSPLTPETSSALTALGDQLLANNWVEAAHVCYLLSPQTSLVGGFGSPSARVTLVGAKNPADVMKNSDSLVFSEILEFALSLVPVAKGQEPFHGIPHLQAYRFIKAIQLAEIGQIQVANRYCEAVTTSLSHTSPYTNIALLEQLQGLQQRLSGVFPGDKSGSWIGGKLTKPSLDSIGGWLEGRFTKLVTGESEAAPPTNDPSKSIDQPFAGPFAHYSTISSNTPSARSSPQPQPPSATFNGPPQRTASAMATATPYSQQTQVERSSSAMGYVRQRPSVQTQGSSNTLSSSQSSPIGYGLNNFSRGSDAYAPKAQEFSPNDEIETPIQTSWWGASNGANEASNTPTAATFMKVDESSVQANNDGFISLMDNQQFFVGPTKHVSPAPPTIDEDDGDDNDDDLGLGNSKPKPKVQQEGSSPIREDSKSDPPKAAAAEPAKTETPAASGGSWLGRWFKRSESTPAPIKASLGEESAFYYDKEQKRWVNRKAGNDEPAKPAAPPPPPSRAQTASPGMSGSKPHPPADAPPPRPASAVDLSEPPVRAPMRIRSNLAPPMESAPSTPTGTRLSPSGPPPPTRPKSQAGKRNVRSRYVDVFQQEGGGAA